MSNAMCVLETKLTDLAEYGSVEDLVDAGL
jgi:hypothetical protein